MYYPRYNYYGHQRFQKHPIVYSYPFSSLRQYPPVDITIFSQSVKTFRVIMKQGELLLDKLGDTAFSHKLMDAAQRGNQAEVDRLIKGIGGLNVPVQVRYTPSAIIFNLQPPAEESTDCCTLTVTLKWGQ
ncbi:hypothetical protein [Metabacillus arenae]|uniref:Uncharacterized protein n=1 Tax=Metabacillus arenae TaxID=2771434 RepID=A0A926NBE6_9BACI|nr:hypothetical protein [Metabacillus arenae]MBD1380369.1 hypothetical protein [Metabacillus arenae]